MMLIISLLESKNKITIPIDNSDKSTILIIIAAIAPTLAALGVYLKNKQVLSHTQAAKVNAEEAKINATEAKITAKEVALEIKALRDEILRVSRHNATLEEQNKGK